MRFVTIAIALSATSAAGWAKDGKLDDPNRKVCVSQGQTGSYFTKRICHTRAEWQAIEAQQRSGVDAMRQGAMRSPTAVTPG